MLVVPGIRGLQCKPWSRFGRSAPGRGEVGWLSVPSRCFLETQSSLGTTSSDCLPQCRFLPVLEVLFEVEAFSNQATLKMKEEL